ncbi:MAG TPA: hypothetical protein DEF51_37375 [Myxococcales bacterium]|nr:hypothetical protein [Myxococcales bacterium]
MEDTLAACRRALAPLKSTDARLCLEDATRLAVGGAPWAQAGFESTLDAERRLFVLVGLGVLHPEAFEDAEDALAASLPEVALERLLDEALLEAWLAAVAGAGRTQLAARLAAACRHTRLWPVVRARAGAGDLAGARRLADTIAVERKHDRGLALLELALAGEGSTAEAVAAVLDTRRVETGPDRGGAELHALGAMARRLASAGAPAAEGDAIVGAMVPLGAEGQRRTRPSGFAVLLAEAAAALAERATESGWLDHVETLRAAIVFDDIAVPVDESLAAARSRVAEGEAPAPTVPPASSESQPDESWRVDADSRRRMWVASRIMARSRDSLERYFDALAVGLDPEGETEADRLAAWQAAEGFEAARLLAAYVAANETEDRRWCIVGSAEPWRAVAELRDEGAAEQVLDAVLQRDFATRSYGDWRQPVPLGRELAVLVGRFGRHDWLEAIVAAFADSTRPRIEERVYDFFEALPAAFEVDLEGCAAKLPEPLRPALWAVAARDDRSLAELRGALGEPLPAQLHLVCEAFAKTGRVDEAIALSEHERDAPTSLEGRGRVPAPTQAAVLAIAASGAALEADQQKALVIRMKDAPRSRRDGHSKRLKELRALLRAQS